MSRHWRQVRIFTKNFSEGWYHDLLWEILRPLLAAQPDLDYFFSKYRGPLTGPETDNGDVCEGPDCKPLSEILPHDFLQPMRDGTSWHASIRLRFVDRLSENQEEAPSESAAETTGEPDVPSSSVGPIEKKIRTLIGNASGAFWFGSFLDYTLRDDLGGERFGPFKKHQVTERDTRGELVAAILRANCQLVLGSFAKGQGGFDIEHNQNTNNLIFGTPFQSVGHMLANVWWDRNGQRPIVWAMDYQRGIGKNI